MMSNREDLAAVLVTAGVIGGLVTLIVLTYQNERAWDEYATQHCRVIGKVSSSTGIGLSGGKGGGVTTVLIPGKTGYQCDDGKEYWR